MPPLSAAAAPPPRPPALGRPPLAAASPAPGGRRRTPPGRPRRGRRCRPRRPRNLSVRPSTSRPPCCTITPSGRGVRMAEETKASGTPHRVWTLVVLLFAVFAVAGPVKMIRTQADSGDGSAAGDTVVMAKLAFAPTTLLVAKGTEVVFRNDDVAPHTVTSQGGGPVDSGVLGPGKSFRLVVSDTFEYFCAIHPQ